MFSIFGSAPLAATSASMGSSRAKTVAAARLYPHSLGFDF